jgi:exosortase D (VPLPA-CTERM-specific)
LNILPKCNVPFFFKLTCYSIILTCLYKSSLIYLLSQWNKPDYNYCYLIPFIVFYLIWDKRNVLSESPSHPDWKGFTPFIIGILFFWVGELGGEYYSLFISFWLIAVGCIAVHIGWNKLKLLAFPLVFTLAMFPFPNFIHNKFSLHLQLLSSQIGVSMLHLYGMPAYREGNIIDLGFVQLQVVEACSGLRFLFPLIILSILIAYFSKTNIWKRAFLVFSTLPLAIITNSMRIALTGVIYKSWGADVAEGFFHGFSGWLIFTFTFLVLMLEVWILKKFSIPSLKRYPFHNKLKAGEQNAVQKIGIQNSPEQMDSKPSSQNISTANFHWKNLFLPSQFIVIAIVLSLTLLLSTGVEFREKAPIKKPFELFPLTIGEWTGTRQTMDQQIIESLNFSDYIIVDFIDKNGSRINFYAAYYESQRKGESIHSPSSCIPGSGWIFEDVGIKSLPIGAIPSKHMKLKEAFMQKNNIKQLVYYWFPQRGRILTSLFQLKLYAFWDALIMHRTDGALVRLITTINDDEIIEDAEKRLHSFVQQFIPVLNEFIPD